MPTPDRAFARLVICVCAAVGLLIVVGTAVVLFGWATAPYGLRTHWCVTVSASLIDRVLHSPSAGAGFVLLLLLAIALWVARRERTRVAELRSLTRMARLHQLPSTLVPIAENAGVAGSLDVIDAPGPFAFVYGWLRPRVCVSTGLLVQLTERELEAVLRHERWHQIRRDPMRLLVVKMLSSAFVAVPPIRVSVHQYKLATEVAADQYVVRTMGSRQWLVGALAKLMADRPPVHGVSFLALADDRIAALAGDLPSGMGRYHRIATVALAGELAVASLAIGLNGGGIPGFRWLAMFC